MTTESMPPSVEDAHAMIKPFIGHQCLCCMRQFRGYDCRLVYVGGYVNSRSVSTLQTIYGMYGEVKHTVRSSINILSLLSGDTILIPLNQGL